MKAAFVQENKKLKCQLQEAGKEIRRLQDEKKRLLKENSILMTNISTLYRTATCEMTKLQRGSKNNFSVKRRSLKHTGKVSAEKFNDREDKRRHHTSKHRRSHKNT